MSKNDQKTIESFEYQWKHFPKGNWLLSDKNWYNVVEERILDELNMTRKQMKGLIVLDAGCGQGRWAYGFEKLGCKVYGFDTSKSAVRYARRRMKGKFDVADVLIPGQLDELYGNVKFDLIWCWGVLHHTGDPGSGIKNLSKYLKPTGKIHLYIYGKKIFMYKFWSSVFKLFNLEGREWVAKEISRIGLWALKRHGKAKRRIVRLFWGKVSSFFPATTPHSIFDAFSPNIKTSYTNGDVTEWFNSVGMKCEFRNPQWALQNKDIFVTCIFDH